MRLIKNLVEQIREELHDAGKYAEAAIKCKDNEPDLAATYRHLAEQELGHAHALHEHVVRAIKKYGGEPPAVMSAIWDWQHEQIIKEEHAVKMLLSME